MYTELSILFLCIEIALIGFLGYLIIKKRAVIDKKSLIYALPAFVVVYALYTMATVYNGEKITFYTLFLLIHETLSMVSMELNDSLVLALSQANPWFHAAMIGACILSFITVIFGVFVFFGVAITNGLKKRKSFMMGGDIVIGLSPSSLKYLEAHKGAVLWVEEIDKETYLSLIKQQHAVHKAPLNEKTVSKCLKGAEYHLIVFRDTSYSYFSILSCFEKLKEKRDKRLFLHLEANVNELGMVREKYLSDVSEQANTFVLPFCRYELMARRFIMEHPITKYMPRSFFNENLTLKDEKEVNVVFLGFGKVNYELFKLMATNFQFAKQKGDQLYAAPVHYYTFENNSERFNNEHFIKLINEYDEIFKNSDLPAAEKICDLKESLPMDAHSAETRKQIRALVNKDTYTYFIVSISDDYQDADFAHDLKKYLEDEQNYKIFVRSKGKESRLLNKDEKNIVYFGENAECYLHENIVNNDLMVLSQNVNDLYNDYTKDKWAQLRDWQKLPVVEQYSNINAALNLYFKLHLMGLELKKGKGEGLTKAEIEKHCPGVFMDSKGEDYNYFFGTQAANVLAFIEHSRWNAYYLLSGYKPLPFKEFIWTRNEKGKDVLQHKNGAKFRHACLTTYAGLDKLLKHKQKVLQEAAEKGEKKVGSTDMNTLASIYRYDYMVIDGMCEALDRIDYSVIKREANEPSNAGSK